MKTLTIRLSEDLARQFKVRCAHLGRPQSGILAEMVMKFLERDDLPASPRPVSLKVEEALRELGHDPMDTEF